MTKKFDPKNFHFGSFDQLAECVAHNYLETYNVSTAITDTLNSGANPYHEVMENFTRFAHYDLNENNALNDKAMAVILQDDSYLTQVVRSTVGTPHFVNHVNEALAQRIQTHVASSTLAVASQVTFNHSKSANPESPISYDDTKQVLTAVLEDMHPQIMGNQKGMLTDINTAVKLKSAILTDFSKDNLPFLEAHGDSIVNKDIDGYKLNNIIGEANMAEGINVPPNAYALSNVLSTISSNTLQAHFKLNETTYDYVHAIAASSAISMAELNQQTELRANDFIVGTMVQPITSKLDQVEKIDEPQNLQELLNANFSDLDVDSPSP